MAAKPRDLLLDVSRLIWRLWGARLPTGIDRVCLEYVAHLGSRAQAVVQFRGRVFVLTPGSSDRLFDLLLGGSEGLRRRLVAIGARALPGARRSAPRPRMIYLNVGHTGLHEAALPAWIARNAIRAVYLIHDLIPITHPQFCRAGEAEKHAARIENALLSADGIIGNSQATLDELQAYAAERHLPIPPVLPAWIGGCALPAQLTPKMLNRPHFVAIGTIEGRKNHLLLLKVWESLVGSMGDRSPILLVVGQRGWGADEVNAILDNPRALAGHVRELGRCDDEELAGWLAGARALLMPSFAEGFGLPVIEAFSVGTPVIATDLPVYREVVGDIPTYVDPLDVDGWEAAIRAFVDDSPERERQTRAIEGYVAPGWRSHFARVEDWLAGLRARSGVSSPVRRSASLRRD